jgi:hypothetical protein
MASNSDDETVADILKRKKASVRQAALEPGSPSWDEVLLRRMAGYKTLRKLLSDSEYNR